LTHLSRKNLLKQSIRDAPLRADSTSQRAKPRTAASASYLFFDAQRIAHCRSAGPQPQLLLFVAAGVELGFDSLLFDEVELVLELELRLAAGRER
jgi:hypothetical protein